MTEILVVDDNPMDRHLVSRLLSAEADWRVELADNGRQALTRLPVWAPDLIVTDLRMPDIDGLELVRTVRKDHPSLPIVLITSDGSEEIAVEALKCGAANYTPKSSLNKNLVRTVRHVLDMSHYVKIDSRNSNQPVSCNLAFVLENDVKFIGPLIEHLQSNLPSWSDKDRLQIGMALDEALVNAMHHGNLEVESNLRDTADDEYYNLVRERNGQSPFCDRRVRIQAEFSDQHICVQISDEGPGFDPCCIPDPTEAENLHKCCGRGLFLIRSFMDQVAHNGSGNQITMTKFRPGESGGTGNGSDSGVSG